MDTKLALNPVEFGGRVYDKEEFESVRASGKYQRIQQSWADKENLIAEARGFVEGLETRLAGQDPQTPAGLPAAYVVANHHVWEWTGRLRLGKLPTAVRAFREPDGLPLPVTVIDGETWITVAGVAPLSFLRVRVEKTDTAATADTAATGVNGGDASHGGAARNPLTGAHPRLRSAPVPGKRPYPRAGGCIRRHRRIDRSRVRAQLGGRKSRGPVRRISI